MNKLAEVGLGGRVASERVVAVGRYTSMPIRRAVRLARKEGRLIDLTFGRACRWVFFLDSGHLVLGALDSLSLHEESEEQ